MTKHRIVKKCEHRPPLIHSMPDFGGMILQVHDVIWLISGRISLTNFWKDLSSATACRSTLVVPPLCVVSPVSRKTSQPMYIFWHITSKYGSNHGRRSFLLCLVWSGFGEVQLVGGGTSRHGGHKVVVRWRTATDNKWDNDRAPCGQTYSAKYDQTIWRN